MKSLFLTALLLTLTTTNYVQAATEVQIFTSAAGASLIGVPVLGFGTIAQAYFMDAINGGANKISASTNGDNKKQEQLNLIVRSDIEAYNLSGELSPLLGQIISNAQKINSDMSVEEILMNLDNNL